MLYKYAATIGRWSMFHMGHRDILDACLDIAETVIVIVGSSFESRSSKNPWTFEERVSMILSNYDAKYHHRFKFEPLPDSPYDDKAWYKYIERTIMSKYEIANTVLVGHPKDDTSTYISTLNGSAMFANWIDPKSGLSSQNHRYANASDHRHTLFTRGYDYWKRFTSLQTTHENSESVTGDTVEWVGNWIANNPDTYAALCGEYAAIVDYRQTMERLSDFYPYPINVCASDLILVNQNKVLLVVRGGTFGKGKLALPGGHLELNETVEQCAVRELYEETGIKCQVSDIIAMRTFSNPNRSDRWRVISHTGLIIDNGPIAQAIANDDAAEVVWMDLSALEANRDRFFDDHYHIIVEMLKPLNTLYIP